MWCPMGWFPSPPVVIGSDPGAQGYVPRSDECGAAPMGCAQPVGGRMVDEVIQEFLLETRENLDLLDNELVCMEEVGADKDLLDGVFRSVHTIKGTCGFLELTRMERVSHVGEGLLSKLRDGQLEVSTEVVDGLLAMGDALREMLDACEQTGTDGDKDYADLVERLAALRDGGAPAAAETAGTDEVVSEGDAYGRGIALLFGEATEEPVSPAPEALSSPVESESASEAEPSPPSGTTKKADNIRVDVALLDKLMNLVGELVLARNQVLQVADGLGQDSAFAATSQRLNHITMELQEGVMKTRMQPINNIWGKFPRMVRHLASICGKNVRIEMEGQETELDRTILEAIKDPLTHIIRNSVDHGIESPEERGRLGKSPDGLLRLRAYHESGQVNMEIVDDGRGIDVRRVRDKAIENGLISAEEATRLGERELMQLVFSPGFSTAAQVTNVSGRGVGMDVVKTHIERVGGTVDIQSEPGIGTTLRIKIPLTLAIIPTLIVSSGAQRFAVPQVSLVELVSLDGPSAIGQIEHIHGAPVYRLRGNLLPLVYLNDVLGLKGQTSRQRVQEASLAGEGLTINLVVLQAYEQQFGLVVDEILDTAEIVVKPLGALLKEMSAYSGATILGDGRVALILDVLGIAHASHVLAEHRSPNRPADEDTSAGEGEVTQLLLVGCGGERRVAISLENISRLEEFDAADFEEVGRGDRVIQYRGSILPIMDLALELGLPHTPLEPHVPISVLVYQQDGHHVGIAVDEIVDVVEENLVLHRRRGGGGVLLGSAVIGGLVTDVVDMERLVAQSSTDLYQSHIAELA